METRLRLVLVLRKVPGLVVQHPVADEHGHTIAWLDLACPKARLGIEYDGDGHREGGRFVWDRHRDGRLAELGWLVLRFTAGDVLHRPDRTAQRVHRLLAQRLPRLRPPT